MAEMETVSGVEAMVVSSDDYNDVVVGKVATHRCLRNPEMLAKFFAYLNEEDRRSSALVCKAWRDAIYQPIFWRNSEMRWKSNGGLSNLTVGLVESFVARGIERLETRSSIAEFPELIQKLTTLRFLTVTHDCVMHDHLAMAFQFHLPNLVELVIHRCSILVDDSIRIISVRLFNLVTLRLSFNGLATNLSLLHIRRGLQRLKRLELKTFTGITDEGVLLLTNAYGGENDAPQLEYLDLRKSARLTEMTIKHLATGQNDLRTLKLSQLTLRTVKHLSVLSRLEHLSLIECEFQVPDMLPDDAGDGEVGHGKIRLRFPCLLDLCLKRCFGDINTFLEYFSLMAKCQNLNLRKSNVRSVGLNTVAWWGDAVTSVNLDFCRELDASALHELSHLDKLSEVSYLGSRPLLDRGFEELSKNDITVLTVSAEVYCNPESVRSICEDLPHLQVLKLVYGDKFDDEELTLYSHEFPYIRILGYGFLGGLRKELDLSFLV